MSPIKLALNLLNSIATPILNRAEQVIAILVGQPTNENDTTWQALQNATYKAMETARMKVSFLKKQQSLILSSCADGASAEVGVQSTPKWYRWKGLIWGSNFCAWDFPVPDQLRLALAKGFKQGKPVQGGIREVNKKVNWQKCAFGVYLWCEKEMMTNG